MAAEQPASAELAVSTVIFALRADAALALGLNTHAGSVVNGPVATAHGLAHLELAAVLAGG